MTKQSFDSTGTKLSRFCDGVMEAAWLAALIVVPLFFDVYSSRIFEPDKISLLRSLALLILAAWIVKLVEAGGIHWKDLPEGTSPLKALWGVPLVPLVFALAIVYLLATLLSVTPRVSFFGSYQRLQGTYTTFSYLVIFAALAVNLRKWAQVQRVISTAILASLPVSFYGIIQRYGLDPVPWGGNVEQRVTANMGNSIFLAAYLILVNPLTLVRVLDSFRDILTEKTGLFRNTVRGTTYVFIAALQIIAIYFSGSRGPWLGWMVGLFILFVLLALYWRKRRLMLGFMTAGLLLGIFLVVLNLPNSPLAGLRSNPYLGRIGTLLNAESDTGRVRVLIWQGAERLVTSTQPLEYPDGRKDTLAVLRPLIGYGPESMYVAYNRFYPPELGRLERRNASPDRSHNETWDALATTGLLGLLAYLALFGGVFYFGLKWLGLVKSKTQSRLFLALYIGVGLLTAAGFMVWRGTEYFGVALPFGMVAGVVIYLVLIALTGDIETVQSEEEIPRAVLLIGLLAALAAHFVEINFGIAIAATRTYFWTFAALLLTIGYTFPKVGAGLLSSSGEEKAPFEKRERSSSNIQKKKRRTAKTPLLPASESRPLWLQDGITGSLLVAILLVTLGFDFVNTGQAGGSVFGTIWGSFTRLGSGSSAASFGVLTMVFLSWLAGAVIFASESEFSRDQRTWLYLIGSILGISLAAGLIYWLWHSAALMTILGSTPGTMEEVLVKVAQYEGLAARFYAGLFLLVLGLAFSLAYEEQRKLRPASLYGSFLAPVLIVIALGISAFSNLRVVQADIAFKLADPFTRSGSWPMAIAVYNRAIQLAPSEDFYYLFLGRAYLEQARTLESTADRDQLIEQAEIDLKRAQSISALNTDHTANLARLYSQWASFSTEPGARAERGKISDQYFKRAVVLSPNNARLWDEWALLYLNILQQPDQTLQRLNHSLGLDPFYDWTHAIFAEVYAQKAKASADEAEKAQAEDDAVASYQEAIRRAADLQTKLSYMVSLAQFYVDLEQPQQAISILEEAVRAAPQVADLWRYEQTLAQLYIQTGQKQMALEHANRALAAAPADQQTNMQEFIAQLETMP